MLLVPKDKFISNYISTSLVGMLNFLAFISTFLLTSLILQNAIISISEDIKLQFFVPDLAFAQTRTTTESIFLNGQINSVVALGPTARSVLAGDWSLDVIGGNVTSFSANITDAPSNATQFQSYQLRNFLKSAGEPVRLDNNQSTSIVGTLDVTSNGQVILQHVPANITIANGLIMSIALDTNSIPSNVSFGREPIYGLIRSLVERTATTID
jgi:hypothetical protein